MEILSKEDGNITKTIFDFSDASTVSSSIKKISDIITETVKDTPISEMLLLVYYALITGPWVQCRWGQFPKNL